MMSRRPYLNMGSAIPLPLPHVHLTLFHALSIHRHFPFLNANRMGMFGNEDT